MSRLPLELSQLGRGRLVTPIPYLVAPLAYIANRLRLLDAYELLIGCLVKSRATILVYHRFWDITKYPWRLEPITVQDFECQIQYLSQKYRLVPLDKLVQCIQDKEPFPSRSMAITFDDGNRDNYLYTYPILKKYNVPATIFLVSGHIDARELFWWDRVSYVIHNTALETLELDQLGVYWLQSTEDRIRADAAIRVRLSELTEEQRNLSIQNLAIVARVDIPINLGEELILSWDEVREMSKDGFTFGAHTITHPILTKLPVEEARRQIIESKKRIEEEVGQVVTAFSYPHGAYNNSIKEILKESEFTYALTSVPRLVTLEKGLYELGRTIPGWNFDTFKFYLQLYPDLKGMLSWVMEKS